MFSLEHDPAHCTVVYQVCMGIDVFWGNVVFHSLLEALKEITEGKMWIFSSSVPQGLLFH